MPERLRIARQILFTNSKNRLAMIPKYAFPRILILLLLPFLSRAQSLSLQVDGPDAEKVYLQKLDVDVKVTGNIASTTWTMTFRNDTYRQLEGALNFPLAEGITVSRYAIDINGKLREAVPVEKAKGTTVLEAIESRRVDPGLLERVEGNAFRTRIYPLPPNGTRTVVIGYEETLRSSGNGALDYRLPLSFARAVPKVEINVSTPGSGSRNDAAGNGFDESGFAWSAHKSLKNYKSGQLLEFRIPQSDQPTALMEPVGNHYYTFINAPSRIGSRERTLPDAIDIVWDASLSRLGRKADAELQLLDGYFKKLRNAEITLSIFSNAIQSKRNFRVENGNWKALREAIQGVVYDGGTQLGAAAIHGLEGDEILLFSDGLTTYGSAELKPSNVPVFAITSGSHSDYGALRNLAQQSGGGLIDLGSRSVPESIVALTKQELQLLGVKADKDIEDVFPNTPVAAAGGVAITAISYKAKGSIVLRYGYGKQVTQEIRVDLDAERQTAPGANLGRIWAMQKIAALDLDYDRNRAEIEQLGKRFLLVTRNTSLIVLENLSDYILYGIEPPEELRDAYVQHMKGRATQVVSAINQRIAAAERIFEELLGWWKQDYSPKEKVAAPTQGGSGKTIDDPRSSGLAGVVRDVDGELLPGVTVTVLQNSAVQGSAVTDRHGRYRIDRLTAGAPVVRFSYKRYECSFSGLWISVNQVQDLSGNLQLRKNIADVPGQHANPITFARQPAPEPARRRSGKLEGGNATITGTLKDEKGSPIINAYVETRSGGVVRGRELTDFDGIYTIRPLDGGQYEVTFKFQGKEQTIYGISLAADQMRTVNGILKSGTELKGVTKRATRTVYVPPIIDPKEPGGRSVKTAEQIESSATRNAMDISSLSTQGYQQGRSANIAIGGARTSGTKVIIDGVQQNPGAKAFLNKRPYSKQSPQSLASSALADYATPESESRDRREEPRSAFVKNIQTLSYAFDPGTLNALRDAKPHDQYAKYLELREASMHIPAFYFQASAHFIASGQKEIGLRILSNLAELDLENYELYKSLGYKLRELGQTNAAAEAFRKVVAWRPMDPQSLRDYGLALADQGRYQAALDTLYSAMTMQIDPSLAAANAGMEEILLCDINGLIALHRNELKLDGIPRKLIQPIASDVRVVLNWNMKNTDLDLWVYDPNEEKCYYGHDRTSIGGRMSRDARLGFGPEQFLLRKAIGGKYQVMANFYGNTQIKISGPTVVSAEIYTNWGTAKQQRRMITMQMKPTDNGGVLIGEFVFGKESKLAGR